VTSIVTAITPHPRRASRVLVSVDGVDVGAIPLDALQELGLQVGTELPAPIRRSLETAVRRTGLLDRALDLLAVRGRSARDLRRRLARQRPPADDLTWVIDRLTAQGYVDDTAYARNFARNRIVSGGISKRRLREELYRRGVDLDTADEAIEQTRADVELDEFGAALAAARRRLRAVASLDAPTKRRRLHAFLARRGYEREVIARVLREVM
jgi:regulatory protein